MARAPASFLHKSGALARPWDDAMPERRPKDDSPGLADASADRPSAVGRLYEAHGAALYRYAVMLLADPAAAEDAVQQVFGALLRPRGRIEHELGYLRRAVRNECYSMLRARMTRQRRAPSGPWLEPVAPEGVAPEDRLALERALAELPPERREVVHLHVFEGWTFQQVADASDASINTVAARYRYALAKLRQTLTATLEADALETDGRARR
jgi:RNA polymerase sigma-70 factor (ECF subfamily)